jgi:hypothetical protein
MSKRAIWDAAVGIAGCLYLATVFILNVQSSLFALMFVLIAGYELIGSCTTRQSTKRHLLRKCDAITSLARFRSDFERCTVGLNRAEQETPREEDDRGQQGDPTEIECTEHR